MWNSLFIRSHFLWADQGGSFGQKSLWFPFTCKVHFLGGGSKYKRRPEAKSIIVTASTAAWSLLLMIMSHSTGTSPMQVHSEPCGGTKMIILRTAEIIGQEHWHPKMSWERIFQATIVQIINGAHQFCAVLTNMIKCHWPKSLKVDVLLIFNTLTCNLCNLMLLIYRPALLISNDQWTRLPQDFLNWPSLAFWLLLAPHCLSVARRCTTGIDARPDPQKLTKPGRRNGARLIVDSKIMSWNPNFIWEEEKRRKSSGPVFSLWLYFSL